MTAYGRILAALATGLMVQQAAEAQEGASEAPDPVSSYADTVLMMGDVHMQQPDLAWHDMITNIPGDWVRSARLTFRPQSVPAIAGIAGLTAAFMLADQRLYRGNKKLCDSSPFVHAATDVFVVAGNGATHLGIAAALGIYGTFADDSRSLRAASHTVESLLASGIVVQVLKHMTGREIPNVATQDGGAWRFFPNLGDYGRHQSRYFSYPSGHIASTMSTVTVLVEDYPEAGWLRPAGYGLVGLVGLSLVNAGYHWYSDLPLGVAIGYVVGMAASHSGDACTANDPGREGTRVGWSPVIDSRRAGVSMILIF